MKKVMVFAWLALIASCFLPLVGACDRGNASPASSAGAPASSVAPGPVESGARLGSNVGYVALTALRKMYEKDTVALGAAAVKKECLGAAADCAGKVAARVEGERHAALGSKIDAAIGAQQALYGALKKQEECRLSGRDCNPAELAASVAENRRALCPAMRELWQSVTGTPLPETLASEVCGE